MALESLSNSLERQLALNGQRQGCSATQVRSNPASNAATWNATTQYFLGDWVVDPEDGQMYCWNGVLVPFAGPPPYTEIQSSVLGGTSPYNGGAGTDGWLRAGPNGVSYYEELAPTFTIAGAGAWTVPTNNVITVDAKWSDPAVGGTDWLITVQGLLTFAGAQVAADVQTITLTATGTGAVSSSYTINPVVGATTNNFSCSLFVRTGTTAAPPLAAQTITLSGVAGAAATLTLCRMVAVRLY